MKIIALLCVVLLAGCAATAETTKPGTTPVVGTNVSVAGESTPVAPVPKQTLAQRITDDGNQAIVDAKAAQDIMAPQRAKCYATLLSFVPSLPALAVGEHSAAGVIDAFELVAERVEVAAEIADYQMPPAMKLAIVVDCGPLKARASDLLLLFNLKAVNFAGGIALLPK